MQIQFRDIVLVPNILTLTRIALVFVPAYLISLQNPDYRIYMLIAIAVGIATDILDGTLARKLNQISDLGKILDPVADKICTGVLVVFLYLYSDFPLWAVVLILARDVIVLVLAFSFLRKKRDIVTSNMIGKLAALSWGLVILVYIVDWEPVELPMLWIATGMILVSAISYGLRFIKLSSRSS